MRKTKQKRIAAMTSQEFVSMCEKLLGEKQRDWRKGFMQLTGVDASSVTRYANGAVPVPLSIYNLLFALELLVFHGEDIAESFELGG